MKTKAPDRLRRCILLPLACMALAWIYACGSDDLSASGGIGGTGVTLGEVSDYGSIFVNGVEFDTGQAVVYVEEEALGTGDQVARTHLPIGQIVVVRGQIDGQTGTAFQVDAFYRVTGPVQDIQSLDDHTYRITVLAQTIFVTQRTHLPGIGIEDLAVGSVVKVSGPVDGQGAVHAGLIVKTADTPVNATVALKGQIQSLNTGLKTFRINGLVVDYSQSAALTDTIMSDAPVSVEGYLASDVLVATDVRAFNTESFETVDDFFIEGFLVEMPAGQFGINGYRLQLGSGTDYDGLLSDDLSTGMRVRARGDLKNKIFSVQRLSNVSRVRLESTVAGVDPENGVLTLLGMPSLVVRTNPLTRIYGRVLDLADIAPGQQLRIFGYDDGNQTVDARLIFSPPNPSDRFILQGPVTQTGNPQFALLGVTVDTAASPEIVFYAADDRAVIADDFLAALQDGSIVRVSGTIAAGQVHYETMRLIR